MWLLEQWHGRALLRTFAALQMGLSLSGCIQPLYGPLSAGGDVASELQAIKVEPIPNRLGHYLGNELIFGLNGTGSQVVPKYRLIVTVAENVQTPLLDTVSGYPSAANVVVNADYRWCRLGVPSRLRRVRRPSLQVTTGRAKGSPTFVPRAMPRSATRSGSPMRFARVSRPQSPRGDSWRWSWRPTL